MIEIERFQSRSGEIRIVRSKNNRSVMYVEYGICQSYARADGFSLNSYIHLMAHLLRHSRKILMLGCGGGTLATMLRKPSTGITVVDNNPDSFRLARDYFGMPPDIQCVEADFRAFMASCAETFDGVAIDISSHTFDFQRLLNQETCQLIKQLAGPGGRIAINILVPWDTDLVPDQICRDLETGDQTTWILDQPGIPGRNVIIARGIATDIDGISGAIPEVLRTPIEPWVCRSSRLAPR